MSLVVGKRSWKEGRKSVPVTLRKLGIQFRVVDNQTFWQANRHILHELYEEFQEEAKETYRRLHPDTSGRGDASRKEFQDFVAAIQQTRDAFGWNLQSIKKVVSDDLLVIPRASRGNGVKGY